MKSSSAFDQAYKQLNPEQKKAVDTIDGPVMVVAGPGTGKTQILATRIANILLQTDTNPYAILALTFTESAAKNMRERLISLIGPTAYSVHVQTFHSFCDEVIRAHPEYFPLNRESQVLSDLERYDLMEKLLQNPQLTALRTVNSPYHYLKQLIKTISDLKREGISEGRFLELVRDEKERFENEKTELKKTELTRQEKNIAKMEETASIYQEYQKELHKTSRYDYDDMIMFVATAFEKHEDLLLEYQEKLTYFLIDEYQDTNAAQNKVVDLLASYWGEQANIFVVGDPHQSIYRFQGASLENTLSFTKKYTAAELITLELGYRCPQTIYNAAAEVIQNNHNEQVAFLSTSLKSEKADGEKIRIYTAPASNLETIFVAEEVRKLIESGTAPSEIAILYRNNADVSDIETALEKWGIAYHTDTGNDALQNEVVGQFLQLLKVIGDVKAAGEGYELFEVMNYEWVGLNALHVMQISRAAGKTKMSVFDRIQAGYVEFCKLQFCEDVTAMDFAFFEDFIERLLKWSHLDADMIFPEWFEMVMNESGFLNWLLNQPNKMMLLQHLNALFREVKALSQQQHGLHLEQFLRSIETMREHGIHVSVEDFQTTKNVVTLSTVHKAKGQEWEYVFLMNCIDGKWGNTRAQAGLPLPSGILQHEVLSEKDRNEDDRRLFYVAITRAKKQVTISYADTLVNGNRSKPALGSIFIEEIDEKNKVKVDGTEYVDAAESHLARLLEVAPVRNYTRTEKEWLLQVVTDFKLSVTSLNAYLRSPEEFLIDVLLKVPRAKAGYQVFGTAIHFALENIHSFIQKKNEWPSYEFVVGKFQDALQREILTKDEYVLRLAYGKKILKQYMEKYADETYSAVFIEKFFGFGWSTTMLDDISLNGRVDRIDLIDKEKMTYKVIDYKTGHARTINEIEGKVGTTEFSERELSLPENIRGPYKRQLLFYKLLTQLDSSFSGTVSEGMFDFIEPDRDEKFVRRSFVLTDEDVNTLKELIREVMHEIRTLQFLD